MTKALRGVNLGGWLVLEPWITPSLFQGTTVVDEFSYCDVADAASFDRLAKHRDSFITKADFEWLAAQGIEAVRLPIGYWIFGTMPPYAATIGYVDQAFAWAEASGIKVLVCLHGAPGSQNGEVHSGQCGDVAWHHDPANIVLSLSVIEDLSKRYANHPAMLGIELLNEPAKIIPKAILKDFYRRAYRLIRKHADRPIWVVFSDCFQPWRWAWSLHWPFRREVYLDTHQYQAFTPKDKALNVAGHLRKTKGPVARLVRSISRHRRLIVGEWSAALDKQSLGTTKADRVDQDYRDFVEAQLLAYGRADAWFYWTYRTENGGPWSYRDMVERSIIPQFPKRS